MHRCNEIRKPEMLRLKHCIKVKSAPKIVEQKIGFQEKQQPLARISVGDFFNKLRRKASPPPKSAADLGFLKRDLRKLGSFLGGGEAKAAELQVFFTSPSFV